MRFQIFKNGEPVNDFTLCGAYMFGTDGIGIRRAEIVFENGFVECKKANLDTAGLALLWPVEGFGKVMLPTTCLPDRKKPYIMNVEIARAKLMQIVNKREDWLFFGNSDTTNDVAKKAQALFVKAIQNIANASIASKLADEALKKAIIASEQLATKQAESLFAARVKSHGFGRGALGCRVDIDQVSNPEYVEKLVRLFGSVTIPFSWAEIEPVQGQYDFSKMDTCIAILSKKKIAISTGPLLFFSKKYLPQWLIGKGASFEKIRDVAYRYILKVVARYANYIRVWCPIGGLNVFNHFGFRFEEILEMTRAANMAAKQGSDRAVKIIEICNPWGEYYGTVPNSIPPLVYMDMLVQSGVNFDAFGLQMRFGRDQSGMHVRDMMQISAILDFLGPIAKPLFLTRVEVPSKNGTGPQSGEMAGIWHNEWDEARQGKWIEQFYRIALSKPFVDSVIYSNLTDVDTTTIANSGLLTKELNLKKSYQILSRLHENLFIR
ncbi:MAG: beta-galactosidase [Candidatus Babeliaceae bacterium]|nr:beta-galactosidase [Candidatus Babeliaceae bacterium]